MSVKTRNESYKIRKELELKDKHHADEMELEREKSGRSARAGVLGSAIGGIAKGAATALLNHPDWYKKFGDYKLYANIPTWFSKSMSVKAMTKFQAPTVNLPVSTTTKLGRELAAESTLASVLVHKFVPTLGYTADKVQSSARDYPINETMKIVLTEIGKVNSRAVDPDNSIPGIYLLSCTEIAGLLSEIKFILDVIDQFSENDKSIPKALIQGKGWDYEFILHNVSELRRIYDLYVKKFNVSLPVPKSFDLINRRCWMNSVIIKDTDSAKPIYQMFGQVIFCVGTSEGFSGSAFISGNNNDKTVRDQCNSAGNLVPLITFLDLAFNNILDDNDFCTFIANLRAATSDFWTLPLIDQSRININALDDSIRDQLMNIVTLPGAFVSVPNSSILSMATLLSSVDFDANGDLYQYMDMIGASTSQYAHFYTTSVENSAKLVCGSSQVQLSAIGAFNSYKPKLNEDDLLTMTRLHPEYDVVEYTLSVGNIYATDIVYVSRGTEVVMYSQVILMDPSVGYGLDVVRVTNDLMASMYGTQEFSSNILHSQAVDGLYNTFIIYEDDGTYYCNSIQQWDNCFVITEQNLSQLHRLCSRSLYYCTPSAFKGRYTK